MSKKLLVLFLAGFISFACSNKDPKGQTLAEVNGVAITLEIFNAEFGKLPQQYQEVFKDDKAGFLEELITRQLLRQEADKWATAHPEQARAIPTHDPERRQELLIRKLLESVAQNIQITEEEKERFYHEQQDQMGGQSYAQVQASIEAYLRQQKQGEAIDDFIEGLRKKARITRNEKWLAAEAAKVKNPLNDAFASGKVTVVDFGASNCLPCIRMKPIFAELTEEYQRRANILLLEISEYRSLARKYKIMLIPTQIFFDTRGNEVYRHTGFMPKEEIVKKLKEMGVN